MNRSLSVQAAEAQIISGAKANFGFWAMESQSKS